MRLSLYSYNYAPEPTGIPYYNTEMCAWLARHLGWAVTAHTGVPHYPWWQVPEAYAERDYRGGRGDEVIDAVKVERVWHYVPTAPVGGLKRMRLDASWLWRTFLRSLGARRRPHAIVLIAPPFLSAALGVWLQLRFKAPVIYHVQDLQIDAAIELGMLPPWLSGTLLWLERRLLARMDLVTTVSHGMRRRLLEKLPAKRRVRMFPNWADLSSIRPHAGANRFRREWGIDEDQVVVLYSGNLGRKQGVEVLLAAVARMRQPVWLMIAGEGAERAEIERTARDLGLPRVRFLPLAPRELLAEFLSAADLHCIPQRRAAAGLVMPSKLLNIMAVARAVVVTADPGTDLAMVVQAAGCGEVVEPESPEALAAALAVLSGDRHRRAAQGANGRRYVERHLGIDAVVGGFAQRLEKLVKRHQRSAA
jgi:colanic acid biosynthesis glycosyl transferase WcaI